MGRAAPEPQRLELGQRLDAFFTNWEPYVGAATAIVALARSAARVETAVATT